MDALHGSAHFIKTEVSVSGTSSDTPSVARDLIPQSSYTSKPAASNQTYEKKIVPSMQILVPFLTKIMIHGWCKEIEMNE